MGSGCSLALVYRLLSLGLDCWGLVEQILLRGVVEPVMFSDVVLPGHDGFGSDHDQHVLCLLEQGPQVG